ncbi:hypothetical protein [Pseudomonas viridiflava]|uniref:hypothetical protein n=1 Tax=Pseudomonas viridiflava TaxID=33069 RepID=UPI0019CF801A|nr:hypothetical protein [Pseudomonas viridiflava]
MINSKKIPTINYSRTSRAVSPNLAAPFVPDAFHDDDNEGLLPIEKLDLPVRVEFKVWDAANPGDTYQIFWNGSVTGEPKTIDDEQPGDELVLEIPVADLVEGVHSLRYQTINSENGVKEQSLHTRVEVDLTPPGRPQLGPVKLPPEVDGGLTSAELTQLGDKLDVEIGSYTGMAKHDVVRTFWGDVEGPGADVTADDMGLRRVIITYSREFLEGLGSFNGIVSYSVTDRAGNTSARSLGVLVRLLLEEIPDDFPAPIIDPALGGLIDYAEAKAGVNVDIPHYPDAAALDLIVLHWGDGNSSLPLPLPAGNENEDIVLSITVPYETIAITPEGRPNVTYEVLRAGQSIGSSLISNVDVFLTLPVAEQLDAPVIQGTSVTNPNLDDNFIDEDDYELNARAIVKWKSDFRTSDDLNLSWGQELIPQWYQIKDTDVTAQRDLNIPISSRIVKNQGTGPAIPVRYNVTRFGNPNPANSLSQDVVVRSREETPGGIDGLDGPTFITNAGGVVGPIENPDGAPVTIVPYVNILRHQIIQFTFIAFDDNNNPLEAANYQDERELDANDVINGYTFKVPATHLKLICRGYGEAHFKVIPPEESNQSPATSRTTRVRINMSKPSSACNWRH